MSTDLQNKNIAPSLRDDAVPSAASSAPSSVFFKLAQAGSVATFLLGGAYIGFHCWSFVEAAEAYHLIRSLPCETAPVQNTTPSQQADHAFASTAQDTDGGMGCNPQKVEQEIDQRIDRYNTLQKWNRGIAYGALGTVGLSGLFVFLSLPRRQKQKEGTSFEKNSLS